MRAILILSLATALACGDDDTGMMMGTDSGPGTDTGPMGTDAGTDTGPMGTDSGPEDAGTDAGPMQECDPFVAESCGADAKCAAAFELDMDGEVVEVFYTCIPGTRWVDPGVRCTFGDIEVEGREGQVRADNCGEGFFCSTNDAGRRACIQMCAPGVTDCGTDGVCLLANSEPEFGFCRTASNCDPVLQTGCEVAEGEPEQACYVLGATNGDLVADCFEWGPADGEDGMAGSSCMFIDQCAPGLRCSPVSDEAAECLPFCDASAEPNPDSFMCEAPEECQAFEIEDGAEVRVATPPGICAEPAAT